MRQKAMSSTCESTLLLLLAESQQTPRLPFVYKSGTCDELLCESFQVLSLQIKAQKYNIILNTNIKRM
jgi:hypothetical protein